MKATRRAFIGAAGWLAASALLKGEERKRTSFQMACMTLPYAQFAWERALEGIRAAGFKFVAWGTTHRSASGEEKPVIGPGEPPSRARELAAQCRDRGLEPVMLFSMVYPEHRDAPEVFRSRIKQAEAAGIKQVLTFGHTEGGHREVWVKRFREWGPIARDAGVTIVLKQHGGETGTGESCAEIVRAVANEGVKVNYDAGNVMDYLNVDPIPDLRTCAAEVRSFCIKDHRNWPKDEDCGPGLGEIDHYKLLGQVAFTGMEMPLCCENVSAPLLPRPHDPAQVDRLAQRAREFLELVIEGLQRTT